MIRQSTNTTNRSESDGVKEMKLRPQATSTVKESELKLVSQGIAGIPISHNNSKAVIAIRISILRFTPFFLEYLSCNENTKVK